MRCLHSLPLLLYSLLLSLFLTPASATGVGGGASNQVSASNVWTIKGGTTDGGCDINNRKDTIDTWFDESGEMAAWAAKAIVNYYSNKYVQKAASTFFGIKPPIGSSRLPTARQNKLDTIIKTLENILEFHDDNYWDKTWTPPHLFCGSEWLEPVPLGRKATVRDINGNEVFVGNKPKTIGDAFGSALKSNLMPFWSEDLKSYEFTTARNGDKYCSSNPTSKGATSEMGYSQPIAPLFAVTLCPFAFTDTDSLDTLPPPLVKGDPPPVDIDGKPFAARTSLEKVLPKCATLLHEIIHVIKGGDFLGANEEKYGLHDCMDTKWAAYKKQTNPESYVFFITALWYTRHGFDFTGGKAIVIPIQKNP